MAGQHSSEARLITQQMCHSVLRSASSRGLQARGVHHLQRATKPTTGLVRRASAQVVNNTMSNRSCSDNHNRLGEAPLLTCGSAPAHQPLVLVCRPYQIIVWGATGFTGTLLSSSKITNSTPGPVHGH